MIRNMGQVNFIGQMDEYKKVDGKMGSNMGKASNGRVKEKIQRLGHGMKVSSQDEIE